MLVGNAGVSSPATSSVASQGVPGNPVLRYGSQRTRWAHQYRHRVRVARQALLNAEARLELVRQRALVGPEELAQRAVAAAAEQVVIVERAGRRLHPPMGRGSHRIGPAARGVALARHLQRSHMRRQVHVDRPMSADASASVVALLEEAARHNQAVAASAAGVLTPVPNDAPPGLRLEVPVDAVRDLQGLLQAGYRVYQSPRGDTVSIWPGRDTPGVRWLDAETPQARPDLAHVQHRLQRQGLIAPVSAAASARNRPTSVGGSHRRRRGYRGRTRP